MVLRPVTVPVSVPVTVPAGSLGAEEDGATGLCRSRCRKSVGTHTQHSGPASPQPQAEAHSGGGRPPDKPAAQASLRGPPGTQTRGTEARSGRGSRQGRLPGRPEDSLAWRCGRCDEDKCGPSSSGRGKQGWRRRPAGLGSGGALNVGTPRGFKLESDKVGSMPAATCATTWLGAGCEQSAGHRGRSGAGRWGSRDTTNHLGRKPQGSCGIRWSQEERASGQPLGLGLGDKGGHHRRRK